MRLHAAAAMDLEADSLDQSSASQVMAFESPSSPEETRVQQLQPDADLALSGQAAGELILPTPPRFFDGEQFNSYDEVRAAVREYEKSLQVKLYINGALIA